MKWDAHQQLFDIAKRAQRLARKKRSACARKPLQGRALAMLTAHSSPRLVSPTQQQGGQAENTAADWLQARGLSILMRNLACRAGEIDLIACDEDVLVFVEVRQRHNARYGGAAASITRAKQQRITRAASYFLPALSQAYFQGQTPVCRFDVVVLDAEQLTWHPHAFDQTLV
ncbi:MAG TPA: YraN family protein [Burkholderiaceae bacterium]|nr:YraN family protein [Burkholderiaceae bacterium]